MPTVSREQGKATFPKHMALCSSAASRFFPTGSYRKTFVGYLHSLDDNQDPKSPFLQRASNWTASPGDQSQWWPLHTEQNWLNAHLLPCSFSKASRSITFISDTLFYWRIVMEINVRMASVQKFKDSLVKSNINGSYPAVWQSFFFWYFSLGTSSYGYTTCSIVRRNVRINYLRTTQKQVKFSSFGCNTSPLTLDTLL